MRRLTLLRSSSHVRVIFLLSSSRLLSTQPRVPTPSPALVGVPPQGVTELLAPGIFYVHVPDALGYHTYVPCAGPAASRRIVSPTHLAAHARASCQDRGKQKEEEENDDEDDDEEAEGGTDRISSRDETNASVGASKPPHVISPTPLRVGCRTSFFMVSRVYEHGGVLWQWRTVRAGAKGTAAHRRARAPRNKTGAGEVGEVGEYALMPFLLHLSRCGGGAVDGHNPIASCSVFVDTAARACVCGTGRAPSSSHARTAVLVPCVLGDVEATVLPDGTHPTPTASNARLDPAYFTSAYIDLLQRVEPPAPSHSGSHRTPQPAYEYVCRVHATAAVISEAVETPGDHGQHTNARGDEQSHTVVPTSEVSDKDEEEMIEFFSRATFFAKTMDDRRRVAAPQHSTRTPSPLPCSSVSARPTHTSHEARAGRIHPRYRNVLSGGLAAVVLAIDTYAAMIARREMTVAAACWSVLHDTKHADVRLALRTHALDIEREVLAAVSAHEQMTSSSSAHLRTRVEDAPTPVQSVTSQQ